MDKNKTYSVEELLKDDFFIRWVKNPDNESNHYWLEMMSRNNELRENAGKAREILNIIGYKENYKLSEDDYSEMLTTLVRENRFSKPTRPGKDNRFYLLSIAASIALLIMVGFAFYYFNNGFSIRTHAANQVEQKYTKKGEKLTLRLPDGTTVKLNSNSSLSYLSGFSNNLREVHLEGEAYFDVKKDPAHPFVIHTGEISTTVLGTEFNVRSYGEENSIEVAVVEGKVKVKDGRERYLLLAPNEVSTFTKDKKAFRKSTRDISRIVAWNKNILVFENASAAEVWKKLENWYGVNIIINNASNIEGRYNGEYENESLETVLRGISFASGFSYEIDEYKNVIIN